MKKIMGIFVCTLLIVSILPVSATIINEKDSNSTIYGDTLYVGGPGYYDKIQDAINDANPGDTVFVYDDDSPYIENILVDKSINIIGENRDTTIIDGDKNEIVIDVLENSVKIEGFTITKSDRLRAGIKLTECNFVTISNNLIIDNFWGIHLKNSHFNNIVDNIIQENEILGIMSDNTANGNIIKNNTIIYNGRTGIGIGVSTSNRIIDNYISNNGEGINLFSCNRNKISRNIITENGYGIFLERGSQKNTITNNDFLENNRDVYFEIDHMWENNFYFRNYWNETLNRFKIIYGKFFDSNRQWINIDWWPRVEPNN